jgi:hypothetical protein
MKYSWEEIEMLADILAAEADGRPVDRNEASRLADRLAESCPEIRNSMDLVKKRMVA